MDLSSLPRLYRTLRPLRRSQLAWRAWYTFLRKTGQYSKTSSPDDVSLHSTEWIPDIPLIHSSSPEAQLFLLKNLARGELKLLNESRMLGNNPVDWRLGPQNTGRIWALTLHYHAWLYDLAEIAAGPTPAAPEAEQLFRQYLDDWIAGCGLNQSGNGLAWHSFAVATRVGWWIRCYGCIGAERFKSWGNLNARFLENLWRQADFLSKHIEWDLRGNHLIRDALGLAWAGRFFEGAHSWQWLYLSKELVLEQLSEQILPDGGHFERSPMYHVHVMEDLATLAALIDDKSVRAQLHASLQRMAEYLTWMRHPDRNVPLFNDGGFNGVPPPDAMLACCAKMGGAESKLDLPKGTRLFRDSGVAVYHSNRWSVFFDVGEVSVPYQPAHAHADTLALECSFEGARLFVDPGTFDYDDGMCRHYDRSTAAHNTVRVDGCNSSELWDIFRVGRRAMPIIVDYLADSEMHIRASHDGYSHLPGSPIHERRVTAGGSSSLTIVDTINGNGKHDLQGGWLLAPDWTATPAEKGWDLNRAGRTVHVRITTDAALSLTIDGAVYHPEYGLEIRTSRLTWNWTGTLLFRITTIVTGSP